MISSKIFWHTELDKWRGTSFLFLHAITSPKPKESKLWENLLQFKLQQTTENSMGSLGELWVFSTHRIEKQQSLAVSPFGSFIHLWMSMLRPREMKWLAPRSQTQLVVDLTLQIKPSNPRLHYSPVTALPWFTWVRIEGLSSAVFISWSQDVPVLP